MRLRIISLALLSIAIVLVPLQTAAQATHRYWEFDKYTTKNSDLYWHYTNTNEAISNTIQWRAGSGNGSTDPCAQNAGWLPNGWYDMWGSFDSYGGSVIKGRSWYFQDKQCHDGTWRTELFIHTEQTQTNGQSNCGAGGDSPTCWENADDFKSLGCIKIAYPNNGFSDSIGGVHTQLHMIYDIHGQQISPPLRSNMLYVKS